MIELKNLSFSYENSSEAKGQLRGIDLHVKKGELVILSGRSGCGKTTLTRILNGFAPAFIRESWRAATPLTVRTH